MFNLTANFKPTGDQPKAINQLVAGVSAGLSNQVLLGVTGSGKTFTMANVIKKLNLPALIISHNKTLAGQLYQEFRDFFPNNAVSYFVSYYDYYQPEAYIPQTDIYIEKEAEINELIDKLRLQTTTNILTRKDVIVVASVSCIYNIGSPLEYGKFILELKIGKSFTPKEVSQRLAELQYERSEFDFKRGTFRLRGERIDIYPAYEDFGYLVYFTNNRVVKIEKIEPISGKLFKEKINNLIIYPAKHYMTDSKTFNIAEKEIRNDLKIESESLKKQKKFLEAERLIKRVNFDLEMIKEVGYVNGIENYSRYFDGRHPGEPPYTLINYFIESFGDNWLLFIDESHMTIPQLRGMYQGDYSRKKILVEFGFRLKAAFDNRPLKFEEFYPLAKHKIYVSATPDNWEINLAKKEIIKLKNNLKNESNNFFKKYFFDENYDGVAQQLVRPTGLVDPEIIIKPAKDEISDLIWEIKKRAKKKQRVLVTTLTKRNAEDLTDYLKEKRIKVAYLHSDIQTLERSDVLDNLRKGKFDALIGVNLLREGLDLPEVALVAILDADKEGFLRSKTSLIQTMGRTARNAAGQVIIYADQLTKSIKEAIEEIKRRRDYQIEFNRKYHIVPKTIYKPIREKIIEEEFSSDRFYPMKVKDSMVDRLEKIKPEALTPFDRKKIIRQLRKEMRLEAENLNFEQAIKIRDKIRQLL
ncbi:MAG: excinuclease ABC subunit UvrB [Microgenomates group bacterium]|nr:excinuclease ABC subunit UvrB [Microgenomates group bacterium]